MKRALSGVPLVLVAGLLLSGCGTIISKLPRVKIEPPAQQAAPASGQAAAPAPQGQDAAAEPTPAAGAAGSSSAATPAPVIKGTLPKPAGGSAGSTGASRRPRYVPVGAQRTLTASDLSGQSKWQLDVLRNEIYAAHGRRFDRRDLQAYFERQTWYAPDSGFSESRLSALEKRNAAFVASYQKGGGRTAGSARRPARRSGGGGQILPFSSDRALTAADLSGLSNWQLDLARNEIYARHGRPFKRADLRNYFRSQGWYSEDAGFSESRLSSLEKRNADFIRKHQ